MSNRSNYSMGSGSTSLYSSYYPASGRGKAAPNRPGGKEVAEVDRLTDLMVQSMENSSDPEFYGEFNFSVIYQKSIHCEVCCHLYVYKDFVCRAVSESRTLCPNGCIYSYKI